MHPAEAAESRSASRDDKQSLQTQLPKRNITAVFSLFFAKEQQREGKEVDGILKDVLTCAVLHSMQQRPIKAFSQTNSIFGRLWNAGKANDGHHASLAQQQAFHMCTNILPLFFWHLTLKTQINCQDFLWVLFE